jgi:uncharacterized protein (TIGR00162 family)
MMNGYVKVVYAIEPPRLSKPYMICGLPGSGYVGKLAVDHLVQELHAIHLIDIYSYSFPPQVMIRQNGCLELIKNSIYYWQGNTNGKGIDMLFLTGDAQPVTPEGEYILAEELINIAERFNVSMVFTLAAYITGVFVDRPKVYVTATDENLLQELKGKGLAIMDNGSITGMNGLILGIAKIKGIKGVCLLGETSGYVVDAKASQAVLKYLLDYVNLRIDMSSLEKRAKDTEIIIKALEQQMSRGTNVLQEQQMEHGKDKELGYIS